MGAFAVAQIIYTAAFGFKPLNVPLGIVFYVLGSVGKLAQLQIRYSKYASPEQIFCGLPPAFKPTNEKAVFGFRVLFPICKC